MNTGRIEFLPRQLTEIPASHIRNFSLIGLTCVAFVFFGKPLLAQRDLKDIPVPDTKAELAAMLVDPNLEVNLYASDPAITKPIHMNFDEKGRLWVATSEVYPQILPGETANDKVVVLEDKDRDGVAESSTVFADNLLIPTGILPGDGGVYVANSTDLIHLSDSDGDGKADKTKIVLSGFGTEDTHHLLHTLRWGPDGRMYLNQSIYIHSHVETPFGVKRLDGGGIWRYEPRTDELEVLCRGLVNPWGHIFDHHGQSFATDGAGGEGINFVFPESVFMTSPGATRWLHGLNPGSPKHCGLEIVTGDHFPPEYQNRFITNDFRSHRVCMFEVTRTDEGYVSVQHPEVIRSEHRAFRPIDVKMGPDGALYVADWYNPIIQHGEVDFRDPRRDRKHGRIWRISYKGRETTPIRDYKTATDEELIQWLGENEEWIRQWSRQELKRRPADRVVALTQNWIDNSPSPEIKDERLREAIWLAVAVQRPQNAWVQQLRGSKDAKQRASAVRAIGWDWQKYPEALKWLSESIADKDWQVRLESVAALDRIGSADALDVAIQAVDQPMNEFIDFALWSSLNRHEAAWLQSVNSPNSPFRQTNRLIFAAASAKSGDVLKLLGGELIQGKLDSTYQDRAIAALCEKGDPNLVGELLNWLVVNPQQIPLPRQVVQLNLLRQKSTDRNFVPSNAEAALQKLFGADKLSSGVIALDHQAAIMIGVWKLSGLDRNLKHLIEDAAANPDNNEKLQVAVSAASSLGNLDKEGVADFIHRVATDSKTPIVLRNAAALALAGKDLGKGAKVISAIISEQKEGAANVSAVDGLLGRQGGPNALLQAIEDNTKWSQDTAREVIRRVQARGINNPDLLARIQKAGGLSESSWQWSPALSERLAQLAKTQGDPKEGEKIYRIAELQCVRCHAIGPAGGQIGPNLVSLGGSSAPDYVIESLLVPDAKMKEGFQSLAVQTEDGEVFTGLQRSRNADQIELLLADGKIVKLATSSIEEVKEAKSIMPAGLVDRLSEKQLVDLIRFLTELGRTPQYSLGTDPVVRSWQFLQYTQEAFVLLNRTSVDAVATNNPKLTWAETTSLVDGSLPTKDLPGLQPHGGSPLTSYVRFAVEAQNAGSVTVTCPTDAKLPFYFDGQPKPFATSMQLELTAGKHWFVVGIPKAQPIDSIRVQVAPSKDSSAVIRLLSTAEATATENAK